MKTALVIGVTGNFGREMAIALAASGWAVKALMRYPSNRPSGIPLVEVVKGSASVKVDVEQAVQDCELIVYAANPKYHRWPQEAMAMLEPVAQVAEQRKLRLLFPGNVYNFNPQEQPVTEATAMQPPSAKGAIRVQMETRLKQASENGAQVTIMRAGDFLGGGMHMSWLDFMLKGKHGHYSLAMPHDTKHVHFWTYLPDLCANAATLLNEPVTDFDVWHDPGFALTTADWQQAFAQLKVEATIKRFPWWAFMFIAPFNPMIKEVQKMRYLWQQPVVLDGTKMRAALGERRQETGLNVILAAMIDRSEKVVGQLKQA